MEPDRAPRGHDPELDLPPRRTPIRLDPYFKDYQRLVANPFLAVLALLPWLAGFRWAFLAKDLVLMLALLATVPGLVCLLHFHCRDCGATGILFRWKDHACASAVARQLAGRRRRFRGPTPTTQTMLWGYLIAVAAVLVAITWRS